MRQPSPKEGYTSLFAHFWSTFLCSKQKFVLGKAKTPLCHPKTCLNPSLPCILTIPLLSELFKSLFRACPSVLRSKHRQVMVLQWKSRRNVHMPIPSVVDNSSARLHQPHDDPFNGPACVFAQQIEPADQMEQVVCEKAHLQPGFVCPETFFSSIINN